MRAISSIAAAAALVVNCAFAEPVQETPSAAKAAPTLSGSDPATIAVEHPPAPLELPPLSQDFQAAMANSQLQTYRYNQLTEQAAALRKLCDTGFGPADICPKAGTASVGGSATSSRTELPTVAAIDGSRGDLSALLVLADGRRVTVRAGSVLPDGLEVAAVSENDVRLSRGPGHDAVLSFGGPQAK